MGELSIHLQATITCANFYGEYYGECEWARAEYDVLYPRGTKHKTILKDLKTNGWTKDGGLWFCPKCRKEATP